MLPVENGRVIRSVLVVAVLAWATPASARGLHLLVYADANGDGAPSVGEPGVAGVVVALGTDVFVVTNERGEADLDIADGLAPIVWARVPDGYQPGPVWARVDPGADTLDLGLRPLAAPIRGSFTFAAAADTHIAIHQQYFGAAELAVAAGEATAGRPAFFTILGDLTQGDRPAEFALVDLALAQLGAPFVPVPGNHDWYDGGAAWTAHYGPANYSFDIDRVHFVVWNLAMHDDDVRSFLGAELARVPKDMTIVALSHAPPDPTVLAVLRDLGVSYLLTGHTHANRTFDHGGLIELNTEPLVMGGLDFTPGGYRIVTVDGGRLTSTHHTVVDDPFLRLVSPQPDHCVQVGDPLIVAAELDGSTTQVSVRIDSGEAISLRAGGGWTWRTELPALDFGTHTVVLAAESRAGAWATHTATIERCGVASPPAAGADWPQVGGAADHAGAVARRIEPPIVERWAQTVGGHLLQAAPVIARGVVYASITDLGDGDSGGVIALELATGEIRWRTPTHVQVRGSPAVVGSTVVVARVDGTVIGLDVETGVERWRTDLGGGLAPQAAAVFASVAADGDDVLVGNQRAAGALAAADGVPRWLVDPVVDGRDSQSLAAIAVDGGVAVGTFNRAIGGVVAWERVTGAERWRVRSQMIAINATPVIADGSVYVVNGRDQVIALDLMTGKSRWETALDTAGFDWGNATVGAPAYAAGLLLVPTLYRDVVALDASTGIERWRFAGTPSPIHTTHYRGTEKPGFEAAPVITGDIAWVVDTAGVLTALDLTTGKPRWHTALGVPVLGGIAVSGDWLVVASYDGTIHAFAATTPDASSAAPAGGCCDARRSAPSSLVLVLLIAIAMRKPRAKPRGTSQSIFAGRI